MIKKITESVGELIEKRAWGRVLMLELPVESYFEANSATVKLLIENGFEGIYISFHRPFTNIYNLFEQQKIDNSKLMFIDLATPIYNSVRKVGKTTKRKKHSRCIHIPSTLDVDKLVRAIYTSIPKLKSKRKFIFIDSLTTITLYKPLSETIRFCEFLIRTIKKDELENVILVFNVAKDLSQKKFIRDIALNVDEVISVK